MLRPVREQAEDIAQIGPGLDVVETAAREPKREGGVDRARIVVADEESVLATAGLAAKFEHCLAWAAIVRRVLDRHPSVA